jgi:hypothetical protein
LPADLLVFNALTASSAISKIVWANEHGDREFENAARLALAELIDTNFA